MFICSLVINPRSDILSKPCLDSRTSKLVVDDAQKSALNKRLYEATSFNSCFASLVIVPSPFRRAAVAKRMLKSFRRPCTRRQMVWMPFQKL